MSDTPPPPPLSSSGAGFCGECGAAMPADARFCGSCGAAPAAASDAGATPGAGDEPTQVGGPSAWQGVAPVVERDPTAAIPTAAVPPVPPGGPSAPPPGGPPTATGPAGGPPPGTGKSKGPLIAAIVVVLALLAGGAFFLLGSDDDDEDDVAVEREERDDEDEDEDEETTTTEAPEEETTTTEAPEEETTTTEVVDDPALTFVPRLDDTGQLVVEVPDFWATNGAPLGDGSPNIIASEDLEAFTGGFQASGVSFTRLPGANADPDATIDFLANTNNLFEACVAEDREDYSDGVFTGRKQVFSDCEGSGITLVEIVGVRADGASVEVTVSLAPGESTEVLDQIENTFNLTS